MSTTIKREQHMQKIKGILMAKVYEYKKLKVEKVGFAERISYSLKVSTHICAHRFEISSIYNYHGVEKNATFASTRSTNVM